MAAAADHDGLRPPGQPPLGALLVQRGLISQEQLAAALAEQSRSGLLLGEILVALGYVSRPVVAQALATQHGGLLKTEYGFATGFGPATPAQASAPAQAPAPEPAPQPVQPGPAADPRDEELAAFKARLVEATGERDSARSGLVAAQVELTQLRERVAELEDVLEKTEAARLQAAAERDSAAAEVAQASRRVEEIEREVSEARSLRDRLQARDAEAAAAAGEWAERISELQRRLDDALAQVERLRGERDASLQRLRDVEERLRGQTLRSEALAAELAAARAAAEPDPESEPATHLLLVAAADGYRLFERRGSAPAAGAEVEPPSGSEAWPRCRVARVGPSPLPRDARRCAYAIPA